MLLTWNLSLKLLLMLYVEQSSISRQKVTNHISSSSGTTSTILLSLQKATPGRPQSNHWAQTTKMLMRQSTATSNKRIAKTPLESAAADEPSYKGYLRLSFSQLPKDPREGWTVGRVNPRFASDTDLVLAEPKDFAKTDLHLVPIILGMHKTSGLITMKLVSGGGRKRKVSYNTDNQWEQLEPGELHTFTAVSNNLVIGTLHYRLVYVVPDEDHENFFEECDRFLDQHEAGHRASLSSWVDALLPKHKNDFICYEEFYMTFCIEDNAVNWTNVVIHAKNGETMEYKSFTWGL